MYLFGASGHGKVIAEIAELRNIKIEAFIDKDISKKSLLDYKVLHDIPEFPIDIVISMGNNKIRKKIVTENNSFSYPFLTHPSANLSKNIQIGDGTVVMAGVSVNVHTKIGNHCIINTNASIDHDCILEDFVHVSPNAALAGDVRVGEGTHIGIGACVIQGLRIGKWCVVGAGAVIIHDVPDHATVVGNPGRVVKMNA